MLPRDKPLDQQRLDKEKLKTFPWSTNLAFILKTELNLTSSKKKVANKKKKKRVDF